MNRNNLSKLLVNRFLNLKYKTNRLVLGATTYCLVTIISLVGLVFVNQAGSDVLMKINCLLIINTLLFGIFNIVMNIWIFQAERNENLIKLEEHYNYQPSTLFFSRLISSLFWMVSLLLLTIITNLIIISAGNGYQNSFYYHLYLSSLGWYAVISIITATLTILFCQFLKILWTTLVNILLLIVFLLFALVGGITTNDNLEESWRKNTIGNAEINNGYANVYDNYEISQALAVWNREEYAELNKHWKDFEIYYSQDNYSRGWDKLVEKNPSLKTNSALESYKVFYQHFDSIFVTYANQLKFVKFADPNNSDPFDPRTVVESREVNRLFKTILQYNESPYSSLLKLFEKKYQDQQALDSFITPKEISLGQDEVDPNRDSAAQILFYQIVFNEIDSIDKRVHYNYEYAWNSLYNYNRFASRSAKKLIYNPFIQFSSMFNGTNYANGLVYNQMTFATTLFSTPAFYQNNKYPQNENDWTGITVSRKVQVEWIYVVYTVFNCLLIAGSYFIFKKGIKK